jgi:hypothetical protein
MSGGTRHSRTDWSVPQAVQGRFERPGFERPEDQSGGLARIAVEEHQASPETSGSWSQLQLPQIPGGDRAGPTHHTQHVQLDRDLLGSDAELALRRSNSLATATTSLQKAMHGMPLTALLAAATGRHGPWIS